MSGCPVVLFICQLLERRFQDGKWESNHISAPLQSSQEDDKARNTEEPPNEVYATDNIGSR